MKTLVVIAHPDLAQSTVNRRWVAELEKYPDRFTVHDLYAHYRDGKIDVAAEQARVDAHAQLVLQFPVYWFNCPPLLKQWLDDVFTYGWAYGSQGKQLRGKPIALAVSAGTPAADYTLEGAIGCTLAEALRPFALTMQYVGADYRPPFAFYGIDSNAGYDDAALARVEQSAADYLAWLQQLAAR